METVRLTGMVGRKVFGFAVLLGTVAACGSLDANSPVLSRDFCPRLLDYGPYFPTSDTFRNIEITSQPNFSGSESPNHEVLPSPNKGLGVFATQLIPQGSPILLEAPLVSIPMPSSITTQGFRITDMISPITSAFNLLSLSDQTIFLSLHDHRFPSEQDQDHLLTIFRSNAYNTGDDRIGLFPKIARINHSCRPNAGNWWSEKMNRRVIYAMRDIAKGEEITVSYIPLLKSTKERQARLGQYGFVCDCVACGDESGNGDKKRVRIGEWLEDLEGKVSRRGKKEEVGRKRVEKARKLVGLMEDEGLGDYMARAYHLAAVFNEHVGDFEEARVWADMEQKVFAWAGKESDEALASANFVESLRKR